MGKFSRDKGTRVERGAVSRFKGWGLHAERNLSQPRDSGHDIDLYTFSTDEGGTPRWFPGTSAPLIGEVKCRAKMPIKWVRESLGENDWLLLQEDRQERLYVVPERIFRELVGGSGKP